MLAFLYSYNTYKTNPCQHCRFEIDDKTYTIGRFMEYYEQECYNNQLSVSDMPLNIIPLNKTMPFA